MPLGLRRADQIRHQRAGRRQIARAAPVEHHLAAGMPLDEHSVECVVHVGQRVAVRHKRRVHARLNLAVFFLRDGQQLERQPKLLSALHVQRCNARDSLPVHILHRHVAVKRQRGQDAQLVGRVIALHVRGRIRLSQPQPLRVGQHVRISRAFVGHSGQDIVRRAVDNAHHRADPVGLKRTVDRPNDRHRAAHACLVIQPGGMLPRGADDLRPMRRQRHLVGGDDAFAVFQRAHHIGSRRLLAAHEFHHHVDFRVVEHVLRAIRQQRRGNRPRAALVQRTHENFAHLKADAFVFFDLRPIRFQQFIHAAADVAAAQKTHDDLFHAFVRPSFK